MVVCLEGKLHFFAKNARGNEDVAPYRSLIIGSYLSGAIAPAMKMSLLTGATMLDPLDFK